MEKTSAIYVAGHTGLVGSAIVRELKSQGYTNLILRTRLELDLTEAAQVCSFFLKEKPEYVFLAAAKVGGIYANSIYPADFIYQNLAIQINVIHYSYLSKVKKLLHLGSSCIYPRECQQPIKEEYLLSNKPETTNEAYAIAKIADIKMNQSYNKQYGTNFISLIPTNVYGPGSDFHPENSHVIPALIQKIHKAKTEMLPFVAVWGTGKPFREFLFVDDLASACVFLMKNYSGNEIINVGTGEDISIEELAELICKIIGYTGRINFDNSKPDGVARKLLDVTKLKNLGLFPKTSLQEGIIKTYKWYLNNMFELIGRSK